MTDWEVKVITESNYVKTVRIDDCVTRQDAERQALSSTGAVRIVAISPKTYSNSSEPVVENHYHEVQYVNDYTEDEDDYQQLDEAEIEMYDLMCQIAMSEGKELPTIQEFNDYLGK